MLADFEWYTILGFYFIGVILFSFICKAFIFTSGDPEIDWLMIYLWPLVLPTILLGILVYFIVYSVDCLSSFLSRPFLKTTNKEKEEKQYFPESGPR